MPEDMPEVPVLDPLVESGVLDMPACTDDLQRRSAGEPARVFADDGQAPCRWLFVRLGNHSTDHPDFSLVGIERLDIVGVPELDVLFFVRIIVPLTRPLSLA